MTNEVENDYIEKALDELIPIFGTRELVDEQKIIALIKSKKIKEAIKIIALYLGLPIEVNISYVPKGYQAGASDAYQSTQLVKTDNKHGTSGITAQVTIPSYLPFYGTPAMVNLPINVKLSENCTENPSSFITVMAHELSHIVLHSSWHKEKNNEFYTDLTAIIFGFADIMKIGRKDINVTFKTDYSSNTTTTTTHTTTYGYLSDENFYFAFNKIIRILNEKKAEKVQLIKRLEQMKNKLDKIKKTSVHFTKYLEYVDKNLNKKVSQEDAFRISTFHQHSHTDNFQSAVKKEESDISSFFNFLENLKNYTELNMQVIKQHEVQLKSDGEKLDEQFLKLKKDTSILERYVGLFYKLKLKFS
jgi:hypothetical protein